MLHDPPLRIVCVTTSTSDDRMGMKILIEIFFLTQER